MDKFSDELEKSLETGFIDYEVISKTQIQPNFISNDKSSGTKVLSYILERLEVCDNFWLSAAFLTTGGLASIHNFLKSFSAKTTGKAD